MTSWIIYRDKHMINHLLDNCFQTELHTTVIAVEEERGQYWHAYKDTVFFMEKGGMASDIGKINDQPVLQLRMKDGKQWHLLDEAMQVGDAAFMSINLHERFRKCQIHTAQHVISALLCNIYQVNTLSHHVSDEENEIEFDLKQFNDKMASELMVMCNGLIRDDLSVDILYPTYAEAIKHAPATKLNHDELRVVRIGNLDYNLCGCMHVPSLRYLQMIYISGYEKSARGYKVKYLCGDQLLDCTDRRYHVLDEACQTLALSHLYLNTGIHKLINEQKAAQKDAQFWKLKYVTMLAEQLAQDEHAMIVYESDDLDSKSAVYLAQCLHQVHHRSSIVLSKMGEHAHVVVSISQDATMNAQTMFNELAEQFQLHGGGNAQLMQGGGIYTKALSDYIKCIQNLETI